MPEGRLPQVSCYWRHATLQGAWRRQAVPARRLPKSARGDTEHCALHGGGRRCQHLGCPKAAATVGTQHCVLHGGGKRCQHDGCLKSAAGGGTLHCKAHGGGKHCQEEGCTTSAQGDTGYRRAHCGGRRCQKAAQGGGTPHCKAHGWGKRCQHQGCNKTVAHAPGSVYCTLCLQREQPDDA
jgi:hypothetical protein